VKVNEIQSVHKEYLLMFHMETFLMEEMSEKVLQKIFFFFFIYLFYYYYGNLVINTNKPFVSYLSCYRSKVTR
jgi:hypothetical protein